MSIAPLRSEDREEALAILTRVLRSKDIALNDRDARARGGVAVQPPRAQHRSS